MSQENVNRKVDSISIERLGNWIEETGHLATKVGCIDAIEPVLQMLKRLSRDSVSIAVIGSPNSGKSSLINQVLQKKLLPVTVLESNTQFSIGSVTDENREGFFIAGDQVRRSLDDLHKKSLDSSSNSKMVDIYIVNQWLKENGFCLIEKPPLDLSDEDEIRDLFQSLLEEADCVMLTIDALMPLKRAELQFLCECSKQSIPVVIVVSKVDRLLEEEWADVLAYISKHTEFFSAPLKIISTSTKSTKSFENSIDELKLAIQKAVDEIDVLAVRIQRVIYTLLSILDTIHSAILTGIEVQTKTELEQEFELKQNQQKLDAQQLVWQEIEQKLNDKRHKVDTLLRDHLQKNQTAILEVLLYELDRTNDIKTWWERDLPFRLDRELRGLAGQLSKNINQQILSDLKWLQEEVSRQFKYPLKTLSEPSALVDSVSIEQREVVLSNSNTLKIFSRIGTAASVILAATILAPGLAGAGLAASVIAGLTTEQLIRWNTIQERELIRLELSKVIERARHQYALEVSRRLKENYNQIIFELKQHQLRWQQAQLQTLVTVRRNNLNEVDINWKALEQQTNQLMSKIKVETNIN